ncbi:hypothetical protein GQL63_22445 [Escherichia coli]|nr:hypothetical protein [Escherichia coli]
MFAGKKSAQIREILISESAWEEMTCLFAPSLAKSSPGMIVMACNKNYNQHEVADCLTLSYREVNRD